MIESKKKVKKKQIAFHRKKNISAFEISARWGTNVGEPLIYLAREIAGDETLRLIYAFDMLVETLPAIVEHETANQDELEVLVSLANKNPLVYLSSSEVSSLREVSEQY